MSPQQKSAVWRGILGFVIFSAFFTVVAAFFVDREPVTLGPVTCSRPVVAAAAIYLHGLVVGWIEYRRGVSSTPQPESPLHEH